jgi:hypothetical protein
MKALRLLTLMAVCCATGTITSGAWAAEPPPARPATPAAAKPASESAAPKTDEQSSSAQSSSAQSSSARGTQGEQSAAGAPEQRAAARPKASGKGGSPERFVPSEQVRADFDVSFPIDI